DTGSQNSLDPFLTPDVQLDFEVVLSCLIDLFFRAQVVAHYFTGGSGRATGAGQGVVRRIQFHGW
ncbi:MAG: hypothetical protein ABI651_20735, partial [Verrucomicrobiota bacterium]